MNTKHQLNDQLKGTYASPQTTRPYGQAQFAPTQMILHSGSSMSNNPSHVHCSTDSSNTLSPNVTQNQHNLCSADHFQHHTEWPTSPPNDTTTCPLPFLTPTALHDQFTNLHVTIVDFKDKKPQCQWNSQSTKTDLGLLPSPLRGQHNLSLAPSTTVHPNIDTSNHNTINLTPHSACIHSLIPIPPMMPFSALSLHYPDKLAKALSNNSVSQWWMKTLTTASLHLNLIPKPLSHLHSTYLLLHYQHTSHNPVHIHSTLNAPTVSPQPMPTTSPHTLDSPFNSSVNSMLHWQKRYHISKQWRFTHSPVLVPVGCTPTRQPQKLAVVLQTQFDRNILNPAVHKTLLVTKNVLTYQHFLTSTLYPHVSYAPLALYDSTTYASVWCKITHMNLH